MQNNEEEDEEAEEEEENYSVLIHRQKSLNESLKDETITWEGHFVNANPPAVSPGTSSQMVSFPTTPALALWP